MRLTVVGLAVASISLIAATAAAQDNTLPSETLKAQTATKGNTDVAKSGFATGGMPKDEDPTHITEASISAGGLFSSGNARAVALTSAAKYKMRRDGHQLTAALAANFARAGKKGEAVETSVENYQGLLRYDYFFTNSLAAFLQSSARRDRFQGLDLRLNIDPGIAYYIINTAKQSLRTEVGYDLQHDIRRDESLVQAPPLPTLDKTQTLHNVRLFGGYENTLYKGVNFVTGLEYLQNVSDAGTYRLVFDVGLKTNIAGNFALATTYTMRYENKPLPTVESTDSIASINLVYSLF
jgi:putative salt-induced outer membrane protein